MKLLIINGENNNEKIEIEINEHPLVEDIKYKLDEFLHGNGSFVKDYFKLIHNNIILLDDNLVRYYTICENDEIWFGKIENFLKKDDVIVEIFIYGFILSNEYLIVKMNDTISKIRSIIERTRLKIINIWNADGKQMKNNQIVTEIDINENYKLFIRRENGAENEIKNTFDHFCYLYDRACMDQYFFADRIRDDNKNESTRVILIKHFNQIREMISLNETTDDRLNQNLSDLPSSFLNSLHLFCDNWTNRIMDFCNGYWVLLIHQCKNDVVEIFYQYFQFAIRTALWDYSSLRQHNKNNTNKSINSIVIDGLDYFEKYLISSSNDWQYWMRLMVNQYLLGSLSDSYVNERIDESKTNKFTINTRINGKNSNIFIPYKLITIIQVKRYISEVFHVEMQHLHCIKPEGDHRPNDEDAFDNEFIIEIVLS